MFININKCRWNIRIEVVKKLILTIYKNNLIYINNGFSTKIRFITSRSQYCL
jgi:hypothetical protein